MKNYYSKKLSAERLKLCYELATPRVKKHLKEEINFVLSFIKPGFSVLELGCGYGRAFEYFESKVKNICGVDTSIESLQMGEQIYKNKSSVFFLQMNAAQSGFKNESFDLVFCIQNGISAFKEEPLKLMKEAIRLAKKNSVVLFSSYSEKFWDDRLEWFRIQSKYNLLGEIDEVKTGDGIIICKDGFNATTFTQNNFKKLTAKLLVESEIIEVDNSSLFCVIRK